jgi:very-short-patch-repair endonuclease
MSGTAFNPDRPFRRRAMQAAGHDPGRLRRKEFTQIVQGIWVRTAAIDRDSLIRSALLIHCSTAYASHLSAAQVHGLPVPEHPFAHVTVTRHRDRRFRPEIKPHVTQRKHDVVVVRGIRTTDPVTTFIQCAGLLGLLDTVILGDALCRRFRISAAELRRRCQESSQYYAGLARLAAHYVRDGVDSPMETRLRMLIVLAGLPEPTVNVVVYRQDGTWRRRYDLCYERIKLIVEYDGRQHAEDLEQWHADLDRREEFDDEGYRILVVTATGMYREPERTLHRIRRQLVLRGWGSVPPLVPTWRQHFAA